MRLKGTHVLVTGAAKRVARVISENLLADEIKLSAHYFRSRREAEELVAWGKQRGREIALVQGDLSRREDCRRIAQEAEARFGAVDILVNSASDFYPTPVEDVTEEIWDKLQDLNLKGQFFLSQALAPSMLKKGGCIVNLCDVNGERPMRNYTPYVVSKAGLLMLTKNLAKEWAPKIRVNAVSPGAVLLPENYDEAKKQKAIDRSLLKRLGSPDDIAHATRFLIENDYITGFNLRVDGGRSLA